MMLFYFPEIRYSKLKYWLPLSSGSASMIVYSPLTNRDCLPNLVLWLLNFYISCVNSKPQFIYFISLHNYHSSSQEEIVLVHVQFARRFENLGAHLERKQQLVPLEQPTAREPRKEHKNRAPIIYQPACTHRNETRSDNGRAVWLGRHYYGTNRVIERWPKNNKSR